MPKVKYMMWLKERVGVGEEVVEAGDLTSLLASVGAKHELIGRLLERGELVVLVDGLNVGLGKNEPLRKESEVVLLPLVSGG